MVDPDSSADLVLVAQGRPITFEGLTGSWGPVYRHGRDNVYVQVIMAGPSIGELDMPKLGMRAKVDGEWVALYSSYGGANEPGLFCGWVHCVAPKGEPSEFDLTIT